MDLWLEVYISTKKKLMGTTRKNLYNDEEHLSDLSGSVLTFRLWVLCIICQFSNPVECYKRRLQKKHMWKNINIQHNTFNFGTGMLLWRENI